MKWFVLFAGIVLLSPPTADNQPVDSPCAGKAGIESIPPEIRKEFRQAQMDRDLQESIRKEIEIANRPRSGLKLTMATTDRDGRTVDYRIIVASAPGCVLGWMPINPPANAKQRSRVYY